MIVVTTMYLVKVLAIQAFLFAFYKLILSKTGYHHLNRFYLLATLSAAFVIPLVSLPDAIQSADFSNLTREEEPLEVSAMSAATALHEIKDLSSNMTIEGFIKTFTHIVIWLYVLITGVLLIRFVWNLRRLLLMKTRAEPMDRTWYALYRTRDTPPFSFLSNIFLPASLFESEVFQKILAHECAHVKQLHSWDRLLLNFLVSLFWFNPFMYLYRNALMEIHEYQADEAVLLDDAVDKSVYQEALFVTASSAYNSLLVSHFNVQTLKKRIIMMNMEKKRWRLSYLVLLPLLCLMIFAFSNREVKGRNESETLWPKEPALAPQFSAWTFDQNSFTPSIFPLGQTQNTRMSSGFGERKDPFDHKMKWHFGVDFACPIGTTVLATADGVVVRTQDKTGGYGKLISIDHGGVFQTYYAQLSEISVEKGELVKRGDIIGKSGNSGRSTAPHLHYEVLKGEKRVNPMQYMPEE